MSSEDNTRFSALFFIFTMLIIGFIVGYIVYFFTFSAQTVIDANNQIVNNTSFRQYYNVTTQPIYINGSYTSVYFVNTSYNPYEKLYSYVAIVFSYVSYILGNPYTFMLLVGASAIMFLLFNVRRTSS